MDRREFLRRSALLGGAALLGACAGGGGGGGESGARPRGRGSGPAPRSILESPPTEAPVDTVVVLMLENRSFDHLLGWLGSDDAYLDAGRRRWGRAFTVDAEQRAVYRDPTGTPVPSRRLVAGAGQPDPARGCGHRIPGHNWSRGRAQLEGGFLAAGSGNDEFALGYYDALDVPVFAALARRFTVCDRSFCSLLASTMVNREYLHSATSQGRKFVLFERGKPVSSAETIWDRLVAAGVPAGYYFVDFPALALFGPRLQPLTRSIDDYFDDAAAGRLPAVTFVESGFGGPYRTDAHPRGNIHLAERFVEAAFAAFTRSPQWERGVFILTFDEWGGFFDRIRPPVVPDARASSDLYEDFGQTGFRVPTILASPHALPGFVDHGRYAHESILRFLEWRFLGAPPEGPGSASGRWFLTERDRAANNIGRRLGRERPDPELGFDFPIATAPITPGCAEQRLAEPEAEPLLGPDGVPIADAPPDELAAATDGEYLASIGYDVVPNPIGEALALA